MRLVHLRRLATVAACGLAALAGTASARADGTPVCVQTGVLAVQDSAASIPVTVGPAVAGPARAGTSAASVSDESTGLAAKAISLGVAGCVDTFGTPGGATARVGGWSILGGAVQGTSLRADLVPAVGDGAGWHLRSVVTGLRVDGRASSLAPGGSTTVGDWGVLRAEATLEKAASGGLRWWRSALQLRLTAAHAGFEAGTTFLIGWAVADREPVTLPPPVERPPATASTSSAAAAKHATPARSPKPAPSRAATPGRASAASAAPRTTPPRAVRARIRLRSRKAVPAAPKGQPLRGTPPLGPGAYTFPVAGTDVSFGDTYGAERSDVPGGWHHGDDLFAPLGTPVVAVTDGTVFSVGWNPVGGWRLWLLDRAGDEFYYAHLSGYTALGSNGRHVQRGDVLGYVGNTGDAVTTPTHLHFEIHPVALLYLGYDGAVDPTTYLDHWQHLTKVRTPPPVPLPGPAPSGWGSAVDFRRLLVIRPLRRVPRRTAALRPAPLATGTAKPSTAVRTDGLTGEHTAIGLPASATKSHHDGAGAVIAGLLLVAAALVALLYTVRSARGD